MGMEGFDPMEAKREAWRKMGKIAGKLLDDYGVGTSNEFSFDYNGNHVNAKYKEYGNWNGGDKIILVSSEDGRIVDMEPKGFFALPEIKTLLDKRISASGLPQETIDLMRDIVEEEGVTF